MIKKPGFSLFEVLISVAIVSTLFGILLVTMVPEVRYSVIGRHIADVQKEGVKAHHLILKDLRETDLNFLRNLTNPGFGCVAISFPTARLNGSGVFQMKTPSPLPTDPLTGANINVRVPDWQGYIIYYLDNTTNILYRRFMPAVVTGRLSSGDTCTNANGGEWVAEGIELCRILSGDIDSTRFDPTRGPFRVLIRANKEYGSKENSIEINGAVNPLIDFSVY